MTYLNTYYGKPFIERSKGSCHDIVLCTVHQSHGQSVKYGSQYPTDGSSPYVIVYDSDKGVTYVKITPYFTDKQRGILVPVTTIGPNALRDCTKLRCIEIPSTVTTIGNLAFYNCTKLDSVYLSAPGSCEAFKSFYLETIGARAFLSCSNL